MISPITGKEMMLTKERRSMDFRKETFEIVFHYYKCEESGEQFTTTSMDEINVKGKRAMAFLASTNRASKDLSQASIILPFHLVVIQLLNSHLSIAPKASQTYRTHLTIVS
jgi:hypothetical protein